MAELLTVLQSSNGSFKSDLMQVFVARLKGDYSKPGASPGPSPADVMTSKLNQNVNTGACIFTPTSPATTTTSTTFHDETDNANILQSQRVTDNQTTTTTTTTTTDTSTMTDNGTTPLILQPRDNSTTTTTTATTTTDTDTNINANVNMNRVKPAPTVASPDVPDRNANVSEVAAILEEMRGELSETRRALLQQVTESTVDAHLATCSNTHKVVQEARARFLALKETGGLVSL